MVSFLQFIMTIMGDRISHVDHQSKLVECHRELIFFSKNWTQLSLTPLNNLRKIFSRRKVKIKVSLVNLSSTDFSRLFFDSVLYDIKIFLKIRNS